jgi:hypothetical protein
MTPSWVEVNAAVLAVLGSLNGSNGRSAKDVRASALKTETFADRLFSLRHAEQLGEVSEVRVLAGTVVTPLALDVLKRRKIRLRQITAAEATLDSSRSRGIWGFAIESATGQVGSLRRDWLRDWHELGTDAVEAARWVVEEDVRGALVLTDEASVATWRANQVEGVRAATVAAPEAVTRAIRLLGANLIVVEAANLSIYQLKEVGERFRRAGAPTIPEWVRSEVAR